MAKAKYKYDLVLLHAPSVYDFRKRSIMYGPVSDVVPSGPIFEMYPIGFATILSHLAKKRFRVRIINLAVKMLNNSRFNPESLLKKIEAQVFGIDLHWLPHAHGSIEVAKIVKKLHPESSIVFGGLSATYYHKELFDYKCIDFCIRGDSTEYLFAQLLLSIKNGSGFEKIPNLSWRNEQGEAVHNPFTYAPKFLKSINIDYKRILLSAIRDLDISGYVPFSDWIAYPVTVIILCRGCNCNCKICGGSNEFYQNHCQRRMAVYKEPKEVASEIRRLARFIKGPIFLVGDILLNGKHYLDELLAELSQLKISNRLVFEFFAPPSDDDLEAIAKAVPHFSLQLSLQSHDEQIRKRFGRPFTNQDTERMIETAIKLHIDRIDLFFMIGLPGQTRESVMASVQYSDYLLGRFAKSKKLFPYISPMAPFLDPGSAVFEQPEEYGYRLFYKTLEEHRQALLQPSWKYVLNYETKWLSRDDILEISYEAALALNRSKLSHGLATEKHAAELEQRILNAGELCHSVDRILMIPDKGRRAKLLMDLKSNMDKSNISTICNTKDLEWSTKIFDVEIPGNLRALGLGVWSFLARIAS